MNSVLKYQLKITLKLAANEIKVFYNTLLKCKINFKQVLSKEIY